MEPVTEAQVRASFVNCSKGEARRLHVPTDLAQRSWTDLDFLGWVDPKAPLQACLVVPTEAHGLVGIAMRRNTSTPGVGRARMCSVCTTTHSAQGVSLMVAARAGRSGREANTVGLDICAGLQCSLYARGLLPLPTMSAARETLPVEARIERVRRNVEAFVARVLRGHVTV
jgi:hypothetical protein